LIETTPMVRVEPDNTAARIRAWLRANPQIAKDKYEATRGRVDGHCYVASEAYFYANGGDDSELEVYCLSHSHGTHWFLKDDKGVIDLSIEHPEHGEKIPYSDATHRAFITGYEPSQRAKRINKELDLW